MKSHQMMKTVLTAFLLLIFTSSMGACNPLKVTDPEAPGFDPDQFSFSDYRTNDELRAAFKVLFPPGTPKEFVDRVLIEAGGAKIINLTEAFEVPPKYILVPYNEPEIFLRSFKKPFHHNFIFDESHKLINIQPFGNPKLFENFPDRHELNAMKKRSEKL